MLAALLALLALAPPAHAYTSDLPTSQGNPMAGYRWFVDWQWGMSQRQYLNYVTHNHLHLLDTVLYGSRVSHERGDARNRLRRRMWRIMASTDPSSLLPRVRPEHQGEAALILKMARNPQTKRYGTWTRHPYHEVRSYLRRLHRADPGSYAFFYVYRLQHHGCAHRRKGADGPIDPGYTGGGYRDARRYRRWIRGFARALRQQPATVFLEPDGLGTLECLPPRFRRVRYGLLRYGIRKIQQDRNATIYLDAGASDWHKPGLMARRLRRAGVGGVRGFFLNSTHYDWTQSNVRYGDRLSRTLGGKHYVVSTAVNGRGPYRLHRRKRYFNELRCNPPGRALGDEPTVRTASIWADAYIWIADPGRSGGNKCPHHGMPPAPPAGRWWNWYAQELARGATWQ